ncbi:uncharacterized protein LOC126795474 [Argentina anserina]|uniref:uncharacterized protein LOC126795474 n=1 Tax=Argentina anserina TaxID=57926 RepID=UPI0021762C66|nr:uncharacterized protein LOC126795474 [Potentilla anserina]
MNLEKGRAQGQGRARARSRARARGRVRNVENLYEEVASQDEQVDPGAVIRDEGRVLKLIKDISSLSAPSFHGGLDHMVADHWIESMETYFDIVMCSEIEKRMIATFFLKDDAMYWWKSTRRTVDVSTLTWEGFVTLFREKYFPVTVQEELELEFLDLVQGGMTVREYDARFAQLYRFVKPIGATSLAQKFLRGLKQEYKTIISALCLSTKELMYESALNMEQANKTHGGDVENMDNRGKCKAINSGNGSTGPKGGSWKRPRTYYQTPAKAACPSARTAHVRQLASVRCFVCNEMGHCATTCPKPKRTCCFKCGQVGHMARDCTRPPQGRQEHQQMQLPAGQARVCSGSTRHRSRRYLIYF